MDPLNPYSRPVVRHERVDAEHDQITLSCGHSRVLPIRILAITPTLTLYCPACEQVAREPQYTVLHKGTSYEILHRIPQPNSIDAIRCTRCGMVSCNPNDIAFLYCGNCHRFHERNPKP